MMVRKLPRFNATHVHASRVHQDPTTPSRNSITATFLIATLKQSVIDKMIRQDYSRIDPKRRANVNHKRKQFAQAEYKGQEYSNRLSFYILPPTDDVTLEEFEEWAINRLKGTCTQH